MPAFSEFNFFDENGFSANDSIPYILIRQLDELDSEDIATLEKLAETNITAKLNLAIYHRFGLADFVPDTETAIRLAKEIALYDPLPKPSDNNPDAILDAKAIKLKALEMLIAANQYDEKISRERKLERHDGYIRAASELMKDEDIQIVAPELFARIKLKIIESKLYKNISRKKDEVNIEQAKKDFAEYMQLYRDLKTHERTVLGKNESNQAQAVTFEFRLFLNSYLHILIGDRDKDDPKRSKFKEELESDIKQLTTQGNVTAAALSGARERDISKKIKLLKNAASHGSTASMEMLLKMYEQTFTPPNFKLKTYENFSEKDKEFFSSRKKGEDRIIRDQITSKDLVFYFSHVYLYHLNDAENKKNDLLDLLKSLNEQEKQEKIEVSDYKHFITIACAVRELSINEKLIGNDIFKLSDNLIAKMIRDSQDNFSDADIFKIASALSKQGFLGSEIHDLFPDRIMDSGWRDRSGQIDSGFDSPRSNSPFSSEEYTDMSRKTYDQLVEVTQPAPQAPPQYGTPTNIPIVRTGHVIIDLDNPYENQFPTLSDNFFNTDPMNASYPTVTSTTASPRTSVNAQTANNLKGSSEMTPEELKKRVGTLPPEKEKSLDKKESWGERVKKLFNRKSGGSDITQV